MVSKDTRFPCTYVSLVGSNKFRISIDAKRSARNNSYFCLTIGTSPLQRARDSKEYLIRSCEVNLHSSIVCLISTVVKLLLLKVDLRGRRQGWSRNAYRISNEAVELELSDRYLVRKNMSIPLTPKVDKKAESTGYLLFVDLFLYIFLSRLIRLVDSPRCSGL